MKFDYRRYNFICTADFETSTDAWKVDEARVWLWDICFPSLKHHTGTSLDSFMSFVLTSACNNLYGFRNLAYDGDYIISWLLRNGYKHTLADTERMPPKTFTTVISDMKQHYAYCVCTEKGQHVTFVDTLKYVNQSIERSAEAYKLPIKKGHIDYDLYRPLDHKPTPEEISYIHNDTEIDQLTIQLNMEQGAYKFTQAGNARLEFKSTLSRGDWDFLFPELTAEEDKFMRKAYNGGFVSYAPHLKGKTVFNMHSLDINSMYPAQMLHRPMPYGYPLSFEGKYEYDEKYPIYIQKLKCSFMLKPNGIAMISSRRAFFNAENLYVSSTGIEQRELTLSSPDLELFFENYNVYNITYLGGYKFQEKHGYEVTPEEAEKLTVDEVIEKDGKGSYFYEYIKKWRYIKEHEPNGTAARDYAKRMQNALYGAMATNPERKSSIPKLSEDGRVKYDVITSKDKGTPAYLPAGIFITAWARYFLIKTIMKHRDIFVYCDTDSLYLKGRKPPKELSVHSSLYGFFKLEHYITMFRVLGSKRYIYYGREPKQTTDKFYVTCCGADGHIKKQINFNTFVQGMEFTGKKSVRSVNGGKHIFLTTYRLGKPPAA